MNYLSVGIMSGGENEQTDSLMEVACILDDLSVDSPVLDMPSFNVSISNSQFVFSKEYLEAHLKNGTLAAGALPANAHVKEIAFARLHEWLRGLNALKLEGSKIMLFGFNIDTSVRFMSTSGIFRTKTLPLLSNDFVDVGVLNVDFKTETFRSALGLSARHKVLETCNLVRKFYAGK